MDSSGPPSDTDNEINDIDAAKLDASHREILEKLKRQELEEREEIERELRDAQREALERARVHEELRAQELRAQELGADLQAQDLRTHSDNGQDPLRDPAGTRGEGPQTEIRTQRPPGLLAQHGLTTKHHHHSGNGAHGHRDRERERERGGPGGERPETGLAPSAAASDRDRADGRPQQPPPIQPPTLQLERADRGGSDSERRSPPSHHGYLSPPMPGSGHHTPQAFMDRFPRPSPPTPGSTNGDGLGGSPAHHWTFEEQFKQVRRACNHSPNLCSILIGLFGVSFQSEM